MTEEQMEIDTNNHKMMDVELKDYRGKILSTSDIKAMALKAFPKLSEGSLLPNNHAHDRFPCSLQKPRISSRHLYDGHHSGSKQVSPEFITEQWCNSDFDAIVHVFDTSSVVRFQSPSYSTPDIFIIPSVTLTTPVLNRRSLRWFDACSCKPTSGELPPISCRVTRQTWHSWHTPTRHAGPHRAVYRDYRAIRPIPPNTNRQFGFSEQLLISG